ncbi:MAG: TolC family protein, partial [Gammaproteobacteria bacterium]
MPVPILRRIGVAPPRDMPRGASHERAAVAACASVRAVTRRRMCRRCVVALGARLACTVLAASLPLSSPAAAADTAVPAPLTLAHAVDTARAGNPGLAELRARADALAAVPDQAGAMPDPQIAVGAANLPLYAFDFDREAMTQLQLGVRQTLPFPGKLALRERIAELAVDVAVHGIAELELALVADVKTLWWELAYLAQARTILDQNERLMRELVAIAHAKYEVGRGLQQDVLLAQLELSKLHDLAIRLEGRESAAWARLGALLAWPPGTRASLPADIPAALPRLRGALALRELADTRPRLAALASRIDAAERGVDLARRERYPDVDVSAGYGLRGGGRDDFASLNLSVSVPLFAARKQHRAVDQKRAELLAERHALADEALR